MLSQVLEGHHNILQIMERTEPKRSRWSWSTTAPSISKFEKRKSDNTVTFQQNEQSSRRGSKARSLSLPPNQEAIGHSQVGEGIATAETIQQDNVEDDKSVSTIRPVETYVGGDTIQSANPSFDFTFDEDLNNSRPYARAMGRKLAWSTNSSEIHTMGWSYFSGTSLADVSQISVLGLPITPQDLWNGHHYSKLCPKRPSDTEKPRVLSDADVINTGQSKRASISTFPLLSPFNLFNRQLYSLVNRRNSRTIGHHNRQIGIELVLIGETHLVKFE